MTIWTLSSVDAVRLREQHRFRFHQNATYDVSDHEEKKAAPPGVPSVKKKEENVCLQISLVLTRTFLCDLNHVYRARR